MLLDWDAGKDALNQEKHGIALSRAYDFDWRNVLVIEAKAGSDPNRQKVIGRIDGRYYVAIVTPRDKGLRVISLRPLNRQERKLLR